VFERLKRRWAEARADVVCQHFAEIFRGYEGSGENTRYFVSSGFTHVLSDFENQFGSVATWSAERKKAIAKEVMAAAQANAALGGDMIYAQTGHLGAQGAALFSFYLELQTLPGEDAERCVRQIEAWRSPLS
jgi:hypothetical protein